MCSSETLPGILSIVKRIMILIQIVVPILLIVFASISLIKLLKNPEEKNGIKKIINQFIAAVIIFFIPLLVNVVMILAGDSNEISSCWNNASEKIILSTTYSPIEEKEKKKFIPNAKDYEAGRGELDFSCTSNTVKAQFSCETLKIVEKHLYDLNADNFHSVINSVGGFENYAKSVGGIFGEYYGKKMPNETVADFQKACEYVLGWMYMYGWDYKNGFEASEGEHVKWGGRGHDYSKDAFYYNTKVKWKRKYVPDSGTTTNFDNVISTKNTNGETYAMASECGDLAGFVYNKLGLNVKFKSSDIQKVSLKDVRVGDEILFGNKRGQGHNAIVGEVYSDHIVVYDGARMVTEDKNYKRIVYIPTNSNTETDLAAIRQYVTWCDEWWIRRHHDFKES